MKRIIILTLFAITTTSCQAMAQRSSESASSLDSHGVAALPEVHTCLTYVDHLVTTGLDTSQVKSPEDLRASRISGPLLAQLIKIHTKLSHRTVRWDDPQQSVHLLADAEHAMSNDENVKQHSCQSYFVGAIAEAVMLHSGGIKGSLYVKVSKRSEDNDAIIAMIFANLISNVHIIRK